MFLCIDTITPELGISLIDQESIFRPLEADKAAESFLLELDSGLQMLHQTVKDVSHILVIQGPGSFTGLRIGLSFANTLSHASGVPIAGITTDEFWSYRISDPDWLYFQTLNKSEVYVSGFGSHKDLFRVIMPIEELLLKPSFRWAGNVSEEHQKKCETALHAQLHSNISALDNWKKISQELPESRYQKTPLDPYYGKEPNITKPKS